MIADLIARIKKGERRALAKAVTLLESHLDSDRKEATNLLHQVSTNQVKSIRVGICGSPGVGKSSFIDVFGIHFTNLGHKVAVLAVDPTSPLSGGSILGDKTRMEQLSLSDRAFIRPSPGRGVPGGITANTHELIKLLEFADFDVVILETVGIGQSETDVANLVDVVMYLHQPESGDDLQAIKKGILEVSDFFVVTKADGTLKGPAEAAARQIRGVIGEDENRVFCVSSHEKTGFAELAAAIDKARAAPQDIANRRSTQNLALLSSQVTNDFRFQVSRNAKAQKFFSDALKSGKCLREISQEFLHAHLSV